MNHNPSLPDRLPTAPCVKCGAAVPKALLRVLGTSESGVEIHQCTNEAACRKRQRQRAAGKMS